MSLFPTKKKGSHLFYVCQLILNIKKIKFTKQNLSNIINNNIGHPSMLTLKDALSDYGIQSVAIRKGAYSYDEFETPFVCSTCNLESL